jgi:hypothetical protein
VRAPEESGPRRTSADQTHTHDPPSSTRQCSRCSTSCTTATTVPLRSARGRTSAACPDSTEQSFLPGSAMRRAGESAAHDGGIALKRLGPRELESQSRVCPPAIDSNTSTAAAWEACRDNGSALSAGRRVNATATCIQHGDEYRATNRARASCDRGRLAQTERHQMASLWQTAAAGKQRQRGEGEGTGHSGLEAA